MRIIFIPLFVFAFCLTTAHAEEWKSSDGLFSFTVPNGFEQDSEIPLEQHQLQHWISKKNACLLTVIRVPVPKNLSRLELKGFMEGFRSEFVDEQHKPLPEITTHHSSAGKTKEGFDYCDATMSAIFPTLGVRVYVRQYAVLVNGNVFKIVFTAYTEDPQNIPQVGECLATVSIHATPKKPSLFDPGRPKTRQELIISGIIRLSITCLVIAGIVHLIFNRFRKKKALRQMRGSGKEDTPFED